MPLGINRLRGPATSPEIQPIHFRVLRQVQHELLTPPNTPEIGVLAVATPAPEVRMVAQRSLVIIGIEPARKPPPGHRAARLRQNEFGIGPREYSGSRSLQAIAQVQPVGRNIQRVACVIGPAELTVVTAPNRSSCLPLSHPPCRLARSGASPTGCAVSARS